MKLFKGNEARRAAVILSGCGVYDGSEIMESSALLFSLHEHNFEVDVFAPSWSQMHVVDHTTGKEMNETRNCLTEAARIARGKVRSLDELKVKDFHALLMPGGFGAAKNLSDFAMKGEKMQVRSEIEAILKEFHKERKVIGACCITPIILAKIFNDASITLGSKGDKWPYSDAIEAAKSFGSNPIDKNYNEVCVDEKNLIVTAPAFMYDHENYHELYKNVRLMVAEVARLVK